MAKITISEFLGIQPETTTRNQHEAIAQVAHNCELYDGALRPMAEWVRLRDGDGGPEHVLIDSENRLTYTIGFSGIKFTGPPFGEGIITLAGGDGSYPIYYLGGTSSLPLALEPPIVSSASVSYTRTFASSKPISRLYGLTAVREIGGKVEESALAILPNQSPNQATYEGDLASITYNIGKPAGVTALRLYRTISGLSTGEAPNNELDTEWHLIDEIRQPGSSFSGTYNDADAVTTSPLDVLYSKDFINLPMFISYIHLGLTESGWVTAVSKQGEVFVSERYMQHAWPPENRVRLDKRTTSAVTSNDNVYVGTSTHPYIVSISQPEAGSAQIVVNEYASANYPCNPGSMAATGKGAMYVSPAGVVNLSVSGATLITSSLAKGGQLLVNMPRRIFDQSSWEYVTKCIPFRFGDCRASAYLNGAFYSIAFVPQEGYEE